MTDRPIIFSAPMVKALLDGRKTQDRRVLKPQPTPCGGKLPGAIYQDDFYWPLSGGHGIVSCKPFPPSTYLEAHPLPYAIGDRLWVREAWAHDEPCAVQYRAGPHVADDAVGVRWRSPIYMPRWASRLTLTVTDVLVQRLQDISTTDVIEEGVSLPWVAGGTLALMAQGIAKDGYRALWNSLHGPEAWDANPWIVALTFTVQRGNIDQIGGA